MTWIGNPEDKELFKLGQFLKGLVARQHVTDIRTEIKRYT